MKSLEMKRSAKALCFLSILCVTASAFSLDREAFSIGNYDLKAQVDLEQKRLGVRGKITLRNDTSIPQKIAVLQISSSLDWRAIKADGKLLQYITQPYTSDIDHTGSLSEAVVTLPDVVAPHAGIELEVAYEGVVLRDATRLTRIGTPEDVARSTDWDEIGTNFTALRGVGHVSWYPIATEVANLSDGNSLFEVSNRWRDRELGSKLHVQVAVTRLSGVTPQILFGGNHCAVTVSEQIGAAQHLETDCPSQNLRLGVPVLIVADYNIAERTKIEVEYLKGHETAATQFIDAAEKTIPLVRDWFGPERERAKTAELPDTDAAPFESGPVLLTPLANTDAKLMGLAAVHQLTHASFLSSRPWLEEGLAHFAQVLYVQQQSGRQAALDYMGMHGSSVKQVEQGTLPSGSEQETSQSLVNTSSEELYRSKAMYVWWMLRDMVGEAELKKAIATYRSEEDKEPSYVQRLISAQTQRDLEWFFDDWVYRDRGLPDFKIESAFSRKTLNNSYILTVTVDNLGNAGAEVPIVVQFAKGEVAKRLEVRAKSKATIRIETPSAPQEVVVNDGSVPESDSDEQQVYRRSGQGVVEQRSSTQSANRKAQSVDSLLASAIRCSYREEQFALYPVSWRSRHRDWLEASHQHR